MAGTARAEGADGLVEVAACYRVSIHGWAPNADNRFPGSFRADLEKDTWGPENRWGGDDGDA